MLRRVVMLVGAISCLALVGCGPVEDGVEPIAEVESAASRYSANYGSMYLRSSFNGWGALPMKLVKNNTWQVRVTAPVNTQGQFKFDLNGNWATSWGRPSGTDPRSYTNAGTAVLTQASDNLGLYFEDHSGASQINATV